MRKVHVYPRGFMSGARCDDIEDVDNTMRTHVIEVEGDPIIMTLFNEYQSKASSRYSNEFRLSVMTRLMQLIGPFNDWVSRQVNNNVYLYDINYDFLIDTIRFINTGKRSISNILTWYDLLNEYPDRQPGVTSDRWNSIVKDASNLHKDDYIVPWFSHTTGFDDIMMSAVIMFGDSKTPRNQNKPDLIQ